MPAATASARQARLPDISFPAPGGLFIAHYPAAWVASTSGENTVLVTRHSVPAKPSDPVAVLVGIDTPVSNDLQEFNRVVSTAMASKLTSFVETSRRRTTCFNQPGIEIEGTFVEADKVPSKLHSCALLRGKHGYYFAYSLPQSDNDHEARQVLEQTELLD